jgi:hypothetical protein
MHIVADVETVLESFLLDNRNMLLDSLEPKILMDVLRGACVLSRRDEEKLDSQLTPTDRARLLLTLVERKGTSAKMAFVTALAAMQPQLYASVRSSVLATNPSIRSMEGGSMLCLMLHGAL